MGDEQRRNETSQRTDSPVRTRKGLVVKSRNDEVSVYDLKVIRRTRESERASFWEEMQRSRTVNEIASRSRELSCSEEQTVWLALEQ